MKNPSIGYSKVPHTLSQSNLLDPFSFRVLIFLASLNPSFPSYETISKITGVSRREVARSIKKLKDLGFIFYEKGNSCNKANQYAVKFTPRQCLPGTSVEKNDDLMRCQCPTGTDTSASQALQPVPVRHSKKNNIKKIKKKKKKKRGVQRRIMVHKRPRSK